jgi:itaconyl-CoA hydratase
MTTQEGWKGRYLEDFNQGDGFRHLTGRTLTETDNTWFTLLTMNTAQLHFNRDYAARHAFGQPVVSAGLVLSVVLGLTVSDLSLNAVANVGIDAVRFLLPVVAGDTLYAETLVTDVRPSQSRPGTGVVSVFTRGINQDGQTVVTFNRTMLIPSRSTASEVDAIPQPETPIEDLIAGDE